MSTTREYLPPASGLVCEPLLPLIAAQAKEADRSRSVSADVVRAIKASDLMGLSASRSLGGGEASVGSIARELEAVSAACASTAWCLWNHLCVFHYYVSVFGPDGHETLAGIVHDREWVTYPNGAGSAVVGRADGDGFRLDGKITFASGARYGEWALVMFTVAGEEPAAPRFALVRLDAAGVRIDPTWDGMSVRASATDDVHFADVFVPGSLTRMFHPDYHQRLRSPELAVADQRYREDWVGLSVLWLAAQACGTGAAALDEVVTEATNRRAIFGLKMAERPGVQFNLADAASLIASARATYAAGCEETDARIRAGVAPTEADLLRQLGYAVVSIRLVGDGFQRILQAVGGNGLRETHPFEQRFRDYQAMSVHVIAHPDRVREATGRWLLGIDKPS